MPVWLLGESPWVKVSYPACIISYRLCKYMLMSQSLAWVSFSWGLLVFSSSRVMDTVVW